MRPFRACAGRPLIEARDVGEVGTDSRLSSPTKDTFTFISMGPGGTAHNFESPTCQASTVYWPTRHFNIRRDQPASSRHFRAAVSLPCGSSFQYQGTTVQYDAVTLSVHINDMDVTGGDAQRSPAVFHM